jgi:N utilization substance protein A
VADGSVEIKGIARQPGLRTIVAVHSTVSSVSAVGDCVGQRGIHVKTIVRCLSGEKIDIVLWSNSLEDFLKNLFAPARIEGFIFNDSAHSATIFTSLEDKALIVGPERSKLKLVSQLVGWDLHVETG